MSAEKFTPGQTVYRVFHLRLDMMGGHVSRGIFRPDGLVACGNAYYPNDGHWWPSEIEAQAEWASAMEAHANRILDLVAKFRHGAAEAAGQPPQAGFLRQKPLAEGVANAGP
jgi:hypothetical protein